MGHRKQRKRRIKKRKDNTKTYIALVFFAVLTGIGMMGSGPITDLNPAITASGVEDMRPNFFVQEGSKDENSFSFNVYNLDPRRDFDFGVIITGTNGLYYNIEKVFHAEADAQTFYKIPNELPPNVYAKELTVREFSTGTSDTIFFL